MPRLVGGAAWGNIAWRSPNWKQKPSNKNDKQSHTHIHPRNNNNTQQRKVSVDPPPQSEPQTNDKLIGLCISCDPTSIVSISPMKTNRYR